MLRTILHRIHRGERGSMAVELAVLAPSMALFILVLAAGARLAMAGNQLETAASVAAREASLSRTQGEAQNDARDAALVSITQAGYHCNTLNVTIDSSGLNAPLGQVGIVRATVSCAVNLADVTIPGLPGTKTLTATATSPVDAYRERP